MTGFSFKIVLFYAAHLCLAARAAPVTTLSPMPTTSSAELETTIGSAMMTTMAPEGDGPIVPPFQCSTQSIIDYRRSVSSLYTGFILASDYINDQVDSPGECSQAPVGARLPIFDRLEAEESTFNLSQGFAIFQAYSKIAHFASQSDTVSDDDQAKMQIVHELLNSLITNYYEVVSPDHCSCVPASSDSCDIIPNYDDLQLETGYDPDCSPAAYISINLAGEFQRALLKFITSPLLHANFSSGLTSCQQWKDDYLPPNSNAASALPC